MKKIILSLLILGLILVACAPTEAPPEPTLGATDEPTEEPAPEPTAAPTVAPTEEPAPEPTVAPTEEPEPEPEPGPPAAEVAPTLRLPDLDGRTVVAVTGNDYTPLNYVDPLSGEAVGWEYDAVNEICRHLDCVVDWQVTAWDTMIAAVQEGQFDAFLH